MLINFVGSILLNHKKDNIDPTLRALMPRFHFVASVMGTIEGGFYRLFTRHIET